MSQIVEEEPDNFNEDMYTNYKNSFKNIDQSYQDICLTQNTEHKKVQNIVGKERKDIAVSEFATTNKKIKKGDYDNFKKEEIVLDDNQQFKK